MTIIQRLCATIDEVRKWRKSIGCESVPVNPVFREFRVDGRSRKTFSIALIACAMICPSLPMTAWTADFSPHSPGKPRNVVAAGVGYENAETSLITVKTYDAANGEILSDETYELNVREDAASANGQPRERIFAGGVGPGAGGLSEFTLRVYDAATGRFLWEGLLNLNVVNQEADSARQVVAQLGAPQATVTKVRNHTASDGQPQFFLRTVDLITGQLMWGDHFSAGAGDMAYPEWVSRAIVDQPEWATLSTQQIQFRIQMMDDRGRKILWEDTIEPMVDETDLVAGHDDEAENLPVWRGGELDELKYEAI